MHQVATYVFIDLETTGIPKEEGNRTKITEISMVAVKRVHVLDTRPGAAPRVQNKLTLCFNPGKMVAPSCTIVTGLSNDLLEHETTFNNKAFTLINTFLEVLQKPVCLIAQNGLAFDFPILKCQVEKLQSTFSEDLLCADCIHAFYDIHEEKQATTAINRNDVKQESVDVSDNENEISSTELSRLENTLDMKSINEVTPKKKSDKNDPARKTSKYANSNINKPKRRLFWGKGSKPNISFKLKDVYERLLNRPALEAHRAENDCLMALECGVVLGAEFVEWIDNNCVLFSEVNPMTIGVPLGR